MKLLWGCNISRKEKHKIYLNWELATKISLPYAQLKFEQGYLDESKALYETAATYAHTPELKAEIQALSEKNFGVN